MDKFIEKYNLGYNSLSNFDIIDVVKQIGIPHFRGVFMRNTLPKRPRKQECGIMNLNTSNEPGSHWVCWYKNDTDRIYFDSFGCICPMELQKYLKTQAEFKNNIPSIQRNSEQVQQPNTQICGQMCLYVLKHLSNGTNFQTIINTFNSWL